MPTRTYIAKSEKNASGFKAAKDRVTLLLCSNASGDRMLKPLLVNRSLKPRELKGKDLNTLPVHWMANKKAWVTTAIFTEWFNKCFVPEVENYMKEMGLEFKILLILDNAPGHPNLEHPNIKEIGGEGFDDFGEHDIEELLVDEALNDDDILESMVDTTEDFETVDSELEDVTPLDEKLLREGLQLSDAEKAFKDDCISRSQSGKWHKAFKEGREEVADEPRSGRPTTARTDENVDRVLEVLRTDRRLSIQQIADTLHMSTFVVHGIVTEDLQMRKVCAKLVPKVLTQDQKELCVLRCQELLDLIQNEPDFLNSVVTGDESWMFEYDPESKRQSCAWHTKSSPRPKKARMSKSRIKTMIIVFFDIRGIVHFEFVPQGQAVNSAFYLEVLSRLKRRIARVRTDIKDPVKLHHDNATSHTAFIITNFLARSNTSVIPHPLTVPT
ncbi:hypothetical protein LAZ67_2004058 [Cordylochernes scorpioides]|uniref:DDE-1 domain-containing protein n=1 Tax=Cordylochernes scorpioides TaxID=51811 RepID=A0ABY6K3I9_9ARAC|nr:hypothetical protein LAZ67_2004058 [Cordylochernes scorpioides]